MNRNIFKYEVYGETRYADPIEARRLFDVHTHGNFNEIVEFAKSENVEQSSRYQGELVAAARKVFDMPPVERRTGVGINEDEVWAVIRNYFQFESKKKASTDGSPTSSSAEPVQDRSTTINSTASGSTFRG